MQAIQKLLVILRPRKCFEGKKMCICIAQSMLKFIRTLYVTFPGSGCEMYHLISDHDDPAPTYFKINCFNPRTTSLLTITYRKKSYCAINPCSRAAQLKYQLA